MAKAERISYMTRSTLIHVGVRTTNLDQSIRFWRDALGLKVVSATDDSYLLTDGYHNYTVFQHTGPDRPAHVSGMLDYLHIGVIVPDLQQALQRFWDMGFRDILDDVGDGQPYDPQNPPQHSFKVHDPDGIVVDVTASPQQWPGVTLS